MPDISSPVKSAKSSLSHHSSVENYVFNFHLSPRTMEQLARFTGRACKKSSHLVTSMMSTSAKKKWNEKSMRLYWVDCAHVPTIVSCGDLLMLIDCSCTNMTLASVKIK